MKWNTGLKTGLNTDLYVTHKELRWRVPKINLGEDSWTSVGCSERKEGITYHNITSIILWKDYFKRLCLWATLTHEVPVLPSHRNQSIDCFLYEGKTGT